MYKSIILLLFVLTAFVGLSFSHNFNICDDSCCPKNTSLKCCCEKYKITYLAVKRKVSWWEALVLCNQNGMDLATILTETEENALSAYLSSVSTGVGYWEGFWIGGISWPGATDFYWVNSGQPVIYDAFVVNEPNAPGRENCLEWVITDPARAIGWNDFTCDTKINFVCQSRRGCI